MAQQGLDRPDIGAPLQQMGGEAVAQRVRADSFRYPGTASRLFYGFIDEVGVYVVTAGNPASGIHREPFGREYVLQSPIP